MKLSHLNALRALEATLRLGSFSAAANELGVTPAAVGQRIRSLEDYLGRQLFHRSPKGTAPTEEARKVLPLLGTGFTALENALAALSAKSSPKLISVTMPESFAENWFARLLSDFTIKHPDVDLHVDASNHDYDLLAESFDFAIRYGKSLGAPFEELDLFGDSVQPVCSPEFAKRYNLHPGRRDLADVPLIHVLNRTGDPDWVGFEEWGRAFDFDPDKLGRGVRFARTASGLQSAIAGQGLMIAGLVESYHALASGQLTMPFGASYRCETAYRYRLIPKPGAARFRTHKRFMDWLTEHSNRYRQDVAGLREKFAG